MALVSVCFESLSCVAFSFGWKFRNALYKRMLVGCGDDTMAHFGVTLEDERTKIGRNVWVSVGSYIDYAEIGDSVLIGPHAVLLAGGDRIGLRGLTSLSRIRETCLRNLYWWAWERGLEPIRQ